MPETNEMDAKIDDLVVAIQLGTTELIELLWAQVESFVKWKANHYWKALQQQDNCRGLDFDDLVQTGYIALAEAVTTFNPQKGTFLTWLGIYLQKTFSEAAGYRTKRYRCDPLNTAVSLDLPVTDETESATMYELLSDPSAETALYDVEDAIWHNQLHNTLETVLLTLPEKYRKILRLRYYENQTLNVVGAAFNVGPEMARQLEKQALRELRKTKNSRHLKPFYDFNFYSCTGLGTFLATGMSVQERYLIAKEADRHN